MGLCMEESWMDKLYQVYEFVFVEDGPYSITAFCVVAYFGIRFIVFPVIGLSLYTHLTLPTTPYVSRHGGVPSLHKHIVYVV